MNAASWSTTVRTSAGGLSNGSAMGHLLGFRGGGGVQKLLQALARDDQPGDAGQADHAQADEGLPRQRGELTGLTKGIGWPLGDEGWHASLRGSVKDGLCHGSWQFRICQPPFISLIFELRQVTKIG